MTRTAPESTTRTIRATVQAIEDKLRRGDLPEEGLADFKAAIDDARLRIWAVLSAVGSGEPEAVLLRFRLRRARRSRSAARSSSSTRAAIFPTSATGCMSRR